MFPLTLAACVGLFFWAPHHRRTGTSQPCTLAEVYSNFFRQRPEIISPDVLFLMVLGLCGLATCFYPAAFVALAVRLGPPAGQAGGVLFVLSGLLAVLGAGTNLVLIFVSHMSFGWGNAGLVHDETPLFWIIPVFQLVFAIASVAMGGSVVLSTWIMRVLSL